MAIAMAAVFIQSLNSNVKWQRHEPAGPEYPSKEAIKKAIRYAETTGRARRKYSG
jgi:hypothetical protein